VHRLIKSALAKINAKGFELPEQPAQRPAKEISTDPRCSIAPSRLDRILSTTNPAQWRADTPARCPHSPAAAGFDVRPAPRPFRETEISMKASPFACARMLSVICIVGSLLTYCTGCTSARGEWALARDGLSQTENAIVAANQPRTPAGQGPGRA
jgi:hypothetical protein